MKTGRTTPPVTPQSPSRQAAPEPQQKGISPDGRNVKISTPASSYFQQCRKAGHGRLISAVKALIHWINIKPTTIEPSSAHQISDIPKSIQDSLVQQSRMAETEVSTLHMPDSEYSATADHEHAILIFGQCCSGKSALANFLSDSTEPAQERDSLSALDAQPSTPYKVTQESHEANAFEMPALKFLNSQLPPEYQRVNPDVPQHADLPKKIFHADSCIITVPQSVVRSTRKHVRDANTLCFIMRHLPKGEDGRPETDKVQVVMTFAKPALIFKGPSQSEAEYLQDRKQDVIDYFNKQLEKTFGVKLRPDQFLWTDTKETEESLPDICKTNQEQVKSLVTKAAESAAQSRETVIQDSRTAQPRPMPTPHPIRIRND